MAYKNHYKDFKSLKNKANLKDLIAATGLVISNRRYLSLCDLEKWWMTLKNNMALLYYAKRCASFQTHRWIQTLETVRKRSTRVKIGDIFSRVTLKFDGWPWKTIGQLHLALCIIWNPLVNSRLSYCPKMLNLSENRHFLPCDIRIWQMTLKFNRAPLLCFFKLCASFHSH